MLKIVTVQAAKRARKALVAVKAKERGRGRVPYDITRASMKQLKVWASVGNIFTFRQGMFLVRPSCTYTCCTGAHHPPQFPTDFVVASRRTVGVLEAKNVYNTASSLFHKAKGINVVFIVDF